VTGQRAPEDRANDLMRFAVSVAVQSGMLVVIVADSTNQAKVVAEHCGLGPREWVEADPGRGHQLRALSMPLVLDVSLPQEERWFTSAALVVLEQLRARRAVWVLWPGGPW
jgi:hypothetical protein